jgi:hypothetical protein
MKKSESSQEAFQIKVTLLNTRPPIWRQLIVPANMTLAQLHDVLQIAMGWEDCHLHEFRIGRERFGAPDPEDALMGETECIDERKVRLSDVFGKAVFGKAVLGKAGVKAGYTYDFGDDWDHKIAVEKVLPVEPGLALPACIGGKRRGPPEDCGGSFGYHEFLEAIRDPAHDRHEDMLEWIGGSFDPESFSLDAVNEQLRDAFPPRSQAPRPAAKMK